MPVSNKYIIVVVLCLTAVNTMFSQSVLWGKKFGSYGMEWINGVSCDASGNIISTGTYGAFTDFDPGPGTFFLPGGHDIFISKLDSNGNFIWAKNIAGTSNYDEGISVTTDMDEYIYVTGYFVDSVDFDPGPGVHLEVTTGWIYNNIFILKLDPNGNFVWVKRFMGTNNGGSYKDRGNSIKMGKDGFIYIGGTYQGAHDFDPGPGTFILPNAGLSQGFIVKLDTAGNMIWANYPGSGSPFTTPTTTCNAIDVTVSGEVYMTGMRNNSDIFVAKYDSSGNLVWLKNMTSSDKAEGLGICIDNAGSVYTTGYFSGQVDFDPSPTTPYTMSSGGNNLYQNIFISKLDSLGNFVWAKNIGSPNFSSPLSDDSGYEITTDDFGNIFVTGSFCLTADFDPNSGVFNVTASGFVDIFVLKIDTTGNFVWVRTLGGTGDEVPYSMTLSNDEAILLAGIFNSNFYPVGSSFQGTEDAFLVRLGHTITATNQVSDLSSDGLIYPNPTTGLFTVHIKPFENAELLIHNVYSKLMHREVFVSNKEINIEQLSAGIYFYEIRIQNQIYSSGKLLKY